MNTNFDPAGRQPQSLVGRIVTALVGVVVLAAAFMFSAVIVVVVAVAGLMLWLYFWWKTRALRQQIREQMAAQAEQGFSARSERPAADGDIIEGEAVRVADERNRLNDL